MSTTKTTKPRISPEEGKLRAETWASRAKFDGIPGRMIEGMTAYVTKGCPMGGFLTALFSNDLVRTFNRADRENSRLIGTYAAWLYNVAPTGCWGSAEKVEAWIEAGGLEGGA